MDKKPAEYVEEIVQFIRENQPLLNRDGVVLGLSGGLDSATTLAISRDEQFECFSLTFICCI